MTNKELVIANKEKLHQWQAEGQSYFWMAQQLGINARNHAVISKWFIDQGIRRKAAK